MGGQDSCKVGVALVVVIFVHVFGPNGMEIGSEVLKFSKRKTLSERILRT